MTLDELEPQFPAIESLQDQKAFYCCGPAPTMQPAFGRWFWIEIPLELGDEAQIITTGH